ARRAYFPPFLTGAHPLDTVPASDIQRSRPCRPGEPRRPPPPLSRERTISMKRLYRLPTGLALLGLLAAAGCGPSTNLLNPWSDPPFTTNSLSKIIVLGVAKNSTIRRTFEDHFVTTLKAQGTNALPSYPYTSEGQLDSAAVQQKLQELQVNGLIVTRVTDKQTVDTYYPPTTSYVGGPSPYYGGWYGQPNTAYRQLS